MKIAGINFRRGTIGRGFIQTAGYSDAVQLRIPVIAAFGSHPGKTLAVVAGQHGRELNGPAAVFKAIGALRPRLMHGTILFFPVANPLSIRQYVQDFPHEKGRQFLGAPPNEPFNVNRNWTGNPKGTLQQRITAAIWNAGVKKADAVIDLHAWTPLVIGLAWAAKRWTRILRAFGFPWSELAASAPTRGMLEWACRKPGIPCITCELPPQDTLSAEAVLHGLRGILNVARFLGIHAGEMEFPCPRYELRGGNDINIISEAPGLVVTTHHVGGVVEKDENVLDVVDLESFRAVQSVRAPKRMILRRLGGVWGTGLGGYHVVSAGETIATLSEIAREWAAGESPFMSSAQAINEGR